MEGSNFGIFSQSQASCIFICYVRLHVLYACACLYVLALIVIAKARLPKELSGSRRGTSTQALHHRGYGTTPPLTTPSRVGVAKDASARRRTTRRRRRPWSWSATRTAERPPPAQHGGRTRRSKQGEMRGAASRGLEHPGRGGPGPPARGDNARSRACEG